MGGFLFLIIVIVVLIVVQVKSGPKKEVKPSDEFIDKTNATMKRQGLKPKDMWKHGN